MPEVARTAYEMISGMTPDVRPGIFVFVTAVDPALVASLSSQAISTFKEEEGMSMLFPVELAEKSMLNVDHPMRCITPNVYSSLEGVGLTEAVSTALGDNAIPCNMVAAFHHDHVFVPSDMCDQRSLITARNSHSAELRYCPHPCHSSAGFHHFLTNGLYRELSERFCTRRDWQQSALPAVPGNLNQFSRMRSESSLCPALPSFRRRI